MKRIVTAALAAMICLAAMNFTVLAADSAVWRQDDPTINVYDTGSVSDDFYAVEMPNADGSQFVVSDLLTPGAPIRLLMINGGFVPGAKLVMKNSRTLAPVRVVAESLGAQVSWDGDTRTVTITGNGEEIVLAIDSSQASVNGRPVELDAPARIIQGSAYLPLRFFAEAMNAQVGYTDKFNDTADSRLNQYQLGIVTIEKTAERPAHSADDGLAAAKAASAAMHQQVVDYLHATGQAFSAPYRLDYDPQDISYVTAMGRYYVYRLAGFEEYNILYDCYTGGLFSQKEGLPFLFIGEGFVNISWLYQ